MDPFKMGLRNLIGITAPGGIVLLALGYSFIVVGSVLDVSSPTLNQLKDLQWLIIVAAFLVSYLFGNIFRLNSADDLDAISSRVMERECIKGNVGKNLGAFLDLRTAILKDPAKLRACLESVPAGFDRWLWSTELFPYPAWEFRKLSLYHPPDVADFFDSYREVTARLLILESRKEFFNYCKMFVASRVKKEEEALLQEVQAAEANVRFFAGTYFALEFSSMLVVAVQLWLVATIGFRIAPGIAVGICAVAAAAYISWRYFPITPRLDGNESEVTSHRSPGEENWAQGDTSGGKYLRQLEKRERQRIHHGRIWFLTYTLYAIEALAIFLLWKGFAAAGSSTALLNSSVTGLLASLSLTGLMHRACHLIVARFRLLRIKEVDTVFEAFYLAQPAKAATV